MDLRKLKKLIDLVQESGISELEVTEGEEKVRIVKHYGSAAVAPMQQQYILPAVAPVVSSVNLDDEEDEVEDYVNSDDDNSNDDDDDEGGKKSKRGSSGSSEETESESDDEEETIPSTKRQKK